MSDKIQSSFIDSVHEIDLVDLICITDALVLPQPSGSAITQIPLVLCSSDFFSTQHSHP